MAETRRCGMQPPPPLSTSFTITMHDMKNTARTSMMHGPWPAKCEIIYKKSRKVFLVRTAYTFTPSTLAQNYIPSASVVGRSFIHFKGRTASVAARVTRQPSFAIRLASFQSQKKERIHRPFGHVAKASRAERSEGGRERKRESTKHTKKSRKCVSKFGTTKFGAARH